MMPACARIDLSRPGPIVSPACRGIGDPTASLRMPELHVRTSLGDHLPSEASKRLHDLPTGEARQRGHPPTVRRSSLDGRGDWTRTAPKRPCRSRGIQPESNPTRRIMRRPPDFAQAAQP